MCKVYNNIDVIHVYIYIHLYIYIYVCTHVRMYVCTYVRSVYMYMYMRTLWMYITSVYIVNSHTFSVDSAPGPLHDGASYGPSRTFSQP